MSPTYTALLNAQAATKSAAEEIVAAAIEGRPLSNFWVAIYESRKAAEIEAERAWVAADLEAPLEQVR